MPTKKQAQQEEREPAIAKLREMLEPGDTVYTVLNHVSRSRTSRSISLLISRDRDAMKLDYLAAQAMGYRIDQKNEGLIAGGYGMDMGFYVVFSLSYTLFPDGFDCVGPVYYLRDHELEPSEYPHIKRVRREVMESVISTNRHANPRENGIEVYAQPLEDADGFLPAYLSTRHNCPSNDHSNRNMTYHHSNGGYALRHQWL
jgi:hypothetical protein